MRPPIEWVLALAPDYRASTIGMSDKIRPYKVVERLRKKVIEEIRGCFYNHQVGGGEKREHVTAYLNWQVGGWGLKGERLPGNDLCAFQMELINHRPIRRPAHKVAWFSLLLYGRRAGEFGEKQRRGNGHSSNGEQISHKSSSLIRDSHEWRAITLAGVPSGSIGPGLNRTAGKGKHWSSRILAAVIRGVGSGARR